MLQKGGNIEEGRKHGDRQVSQNEQYINLIPSIKGLQEETVLLYLQSMEPRGPQMVVIMER